jgi:hypothetical protein
MGRSTKLTEAASISCSAHAEDGWIENQLFDFFAPGLMQRFAE